MIRVVFDPNVLISSLLSPLGAPARALNRWKDGEFDLVVSSLLLAEVKRILQYAKLADRIDVSRAGQFVALLEGQAVIVEDPADASRYVPADPDDDYLVALAVAADAQIIVSGDRHLTELTDVHPPVSTPQEFLARLDRLR